MNYALHERQKTAPAFRALMTVAAALCVLGLAGLIFVHAPDAAVASRAADAVNPASVRDAAAVTSNTARFATTSAENFTGVPSAASVFRGKGYGPREEPIEQF